MKVGAVDQTAVLLRHKCLFDSKLCILYCMCQIWTLTEKRCESQRELCSQEVQAQCAGLSLRPVVLIIHPYSDVPAAERRVSVG